MNKVIKRWKPGDLWILLQLLKANTLDPQSKYFVVTQNSDIVRN